MGNDLIIPPTDFDGGIHYVKEKPKPPEPRRETCWQCGSTATCMPRLYVPCRKLALRQIPDVSALMPMTLCDRHFSLLNPQEFLSRQGIRDAIGDVFVQRGSLPDFDKAVIGRIPISDPDYLRGQKAIDMARRT